MSKNMEFFVPVYKAAILCHSEMLDNLNDFTKFVLWNIGKKKTVKRVNDTIMLGETIIEEEINYMQKSGLLNSLDYMQLTELGKEYFSLMECFDVLGKDGFPCVIELVKGKLVLGEDIKLYAKEDLPENSVLCEKNTLDILMGNDNYENSLELAREQIIRNELLEKQYIDNIYTTLKIDKSDKLKDFYAKCIIKENGPMQEYKKDVYTTLGIPIGIYTYKKYYTDIDQYRTVLPTLKQIKNYDERLLSNSGIKMVEDYEKESSETPIVNYVNLYSGEIIDRPNDGELKQKDKVYHLLPSKKHQEKSEELKDMRLEEVDYDDSAATEISVNMSMIDFERITGGTV